MNILFNNQSPKRKMSEEVVPVVAKRGRPRKNVNVNINNVENINPINNNLQTVFFNKTIEKKKNINNVETINPINNIINNNEISSNLNSNINSNLSSNPKNKIFNFVKSTNTLNTDIILKNIDCANLDKKYSLKEINEYSLRKFSVINENIKSTHTLLHNNNVINKLEKENVTNSITNMLENLSISKDTLKPNEIIPNENYNIKLYYSLYKENKKCELPKRTDIHCFYCRHHFNTQPLSIPIKYYPKEKKFDSDGIFCSFNCMVSFIHEQHNSFLYKDSISFLYHLYRIIYGKEYPLNQRFKNAPSWRLLKSYGGTLSIEEYRKSFDIITFDTVHRFMKSKQLENEKNICPLKPLCTIHLENN